MTANIKRVIIFLLILLIAVGIGFALYYVFFRPSVSPPEANLNVNTSSTGFPSVGNVNTNQSTAEANLNQDLNTSVGLPDISEIARGGDTLVQTKIESLGTEGMELAPDGSIIYYDKDEGIFYKVLADGQKIELSSKIFPKAENIQWSPNKNQAIISFPDRSKILYDFARDIQVTLPKELEDIDFSPQGNKIGYEYMADDPQDRWLGIADPDGSLAQAIEPIGEEADDVQVDWSPNGQVLATYRESIEAERQEVIFIGLHGENFKSLRVDGRGFEGEWSPEGDKMLYSVYNSASGLNPTLHIVEAEGENIGRNDIDLGINTWTSKCAFGSNSLLYCATPQNLEIGAGLFPEISYQNMDEFYKIDLSTGLKTKIATPVSLGKPGVFSVEKLYLSPDGKNLYFTDHNDGNIYSLRLE